MDYASLKSDLASKAPSATNPAVAAGIINGQPAVVVRAASTMITKVAIYKTLGFAGGLALLGTLKAQAASSDAQTALKFGEILDLLRVDGDGLDISLDETRGVIDQLASSGLFTTDVAAQLKALGEQTVSYVQATYGVATITVDHVLTAWRQP